MHTPSSPSPAPLAPGGAAATDLSPGRLAAMKRKATTSRNGTATVFNNDLLDLLAALDAATARAEAAETEAAGLRERIGELMDYNSGLGELLGEVLHDLKEAWGEGQWQNIRNLIDYLQSKAGPAAPSPSRGDAAPSSL